MSRPRVLLVITVYNGWKFVPRCLLSAKDLHKNIADIDVLVLDDASPEPGFSERLAALCEQLGFCYYRSPRNLGIVRNVNLGMLAALQGDYDYVLISNSDVIYAGTVVDLLITAARTDPNIGSVTAWSNNVSIYSAPNTEPDRYLASQEVVNWLSTALVHDYYACAVDIPAGISFSILVPTAVVRHVGLMDPMFGKGYCEETDWSLRSLAAGYRVTLAPAAFVYHQGRGSSLAAGLLAGNLTTVPINEAIIDYRYPLFRAQVDTFVHGGILSRLHKDATLRIVRDAGLEFGFSIHVATALEDLDQTRVCVVWSPEQPKADRAYAVYRGFACAIELRNETLGDAAQRFFSNAADPRPEVPRALRRPQRPTAAQSNSPMYPAHV